ncbi:oligoendopeptidase F [Candidatus Fermentibacteria bacterium]|nr:oligoendopeptidase F [Candidatus Fermentibacteria bacterium]
MSGPPTREQVPKEHRWDIEALCATDDAWESDFVATEGFSDDMAARKGTLGNSAPELASALSLFFSHQRTFERLHTYAHHRRDEDLSRGTYQDMNARISSRISAYEAATSFLRPEILAIPGDVMSTWLLDENLAPYSVWLGYLLRYRPHTLSQTEERLIAMAKEPLGGFQRVFGMVNNADRPRRLPSIRDEAGDAVQLTNANFGAFMESPERRVRHDAFGGFYAELAGNTDTLSALLDSEIRTHVFLARTRRYPSSLEASLFHDQVDVAVYEALISAVRDAMAGIHDYYALKRDVLGLDALNIYDSMAPISSTPTRRYTYDEAQTIVLEGLAPLGDEYVDDLRRGLQSGWVDRFENKGKRSGAYSGGCYDSYPYILHNFNGTLDSVFTLAHEAGHSMHSLLSRRHQPYHMADYPILVAEVASVTNEMLLLHYLLSRASNDAERAVLINHLVGDFRSTIFRQTMFAEFERMIHARVEQGGSLTTDYLNDTYLTLVRDYHGDAFAFDETDRPIRCEWSRVPHFYYNFYVYKYATGMAAAVAISSRIVTGDRDAREGHLRLLRAGSSKPPLEVLRDAGIDLASRQPVTEALSQLSILVEQLRGLLRVQ